MERYICIHGHFYQPPRENPWLEMVEQEDSAYPYHDWNRKITTECYANNAASRILDEKDQIIKIVNNYAKISFNIGPTLLAWMERNTKDIYEAILEADRESRLNFSGHGSAMAQAYSHMILPLANDRDKKTQILWGIRDFEHRFNRFPEGMWLPETAVDLETLSIMAELGIRFTILAPHQAKRVRLLGGKKWRNVDEGKIDTKMPYVLRLPSGGTITLFFYDGPASRAVAFEKLLSNGESFAQRLLGQFSVEEDKPQLVHIATDGESYGHHHPFGDMALAFALHYIESRDLARLTNYGEYLDIQPPSHQVEIYEDSSWSCVHGVERWRGHCGCHTGAHPPWKQTWRKPLREAMDWLRDSLEHPFEEKAGTTLRAPWEARNEYISCILDRSEKSIAAFIERQVFQPLDQKETVKALKLMELQRHAMLMYTSCGWFFDDISGIEALQVIRYAARTLQLAREVLDIDLEKPFLERLEKAESNDAKYNDGRQIFDTFVRTSVLDMRKICAHYAVGLLFDEYPEETKICCFGFKRNDYRVSEVGSKKLILCRVDLTSEITYESVKLYFGLLHLGDHNLTCGVEVDNGSPAYQLMADQVTESFEKVDFPETLRLLNNLFNGETYSLISLHRDHQRRILNLILEATLRDVAAVYRSLLDQYTPLIQFLGDSDTPLPRGLFMAAEFVINDDLRRAFEEDTSQTEHIVDLLDRAKSLKIRLEIDTFEYAFRNSLRRMADRFHAHPGDLAALINLVSALGLVPHLPFEINLWRAQNICYDISQTKYPHYRKIAEDGDGQAGEWIDLFLSLCEKLSVRPFPLDHAQRA